MSNFRFKISGLKLLLLMGNVLVCTCTNAQLSNLSTAKEKTDTRKGNKFFEKDNYTDAEASYKKALDRKNNMPEATFNLGDAVYEQKRYDEAIKQFQLSAQTNPDKNIRAKAFHNLGNTYLEQKKWDEAVKSYKEALRLNAKDNDTKYNLAYANAMIQKEKNNQQNKDQNKKDKKDNKDNKNNKDNKDNKNDQQKKDQRPDQKQDDQQGKNDQQKKGGAQPKLSKADAEKLLQALTNEEQKTNQKVQQKEMKPVNVKIQKDW